MKVIAQQGTLYFKRLEHTRVKITPDECGIVVKIRTEPFKRVTYAIRPDVDGGYMLYGNKSREKYEELDDALYKTLMLIKQNLSK